MFYTTCGKKFNLENFGDIPMLSQLTTKTLDDSLRLKGNLSLDGTIRASRYLMEDGSDMKLSSSQSGLPNNVSFDTQGNMNMNGNMNTTGTIKASKYLMADGSEMKSGGSVQSGLPSNVSFDAQGNMNTTGTIKASKYLMADGSEMKTSSSTQSGLPSTVSFDARGNMIMNGGLDMNGPINIKNAINISGGEATKIQNPDGNLRMNNQGIQFGGGNIKRQINSAQITAGMHIPDSLNIVGMHSKDNYEEDRKVHMWAESGFNVFGGINVAANPNPAANQSVNTAKIKNPDGKLKINNQGIQFGGPNVAGRETNSAQISAGLHVPDSLNIVGMSSDGSESNRKVDMWADSGFTVRGPMSVDKLRIGKDIYMSQDPQGNLIVTNMNTKKEQIINLSGGGPESMLNKIIGGGTGGGTGGGILNALGLGGGTGGEVGRYNAEKRYANGAMESTSGPLMYGVNMINNFLIKPKDTFFKNNDNGPAIRFPIQEGLPQGKPISLTINNGFKATLYYSDGNNIYRPEQLSFPSANKNVWKQFTNPNNKEVVAILVVKDSEPEPPNLLYIQY